MKLFTTRQIAEIDRYTIENEPISDIDLMERAADQISLKLLSLVPQPQELTFFAGPGNNGGDALAVARLMGWAGFPCKVFVTDLGKSMSQSTEINLKRLEEQGKAQIHRIRSRDDFPALLRGTVVIDGLFGSGLTRPLKGLPANLIRHINQSQCNIIAIDIPSGLMGEDNSDHIPEQIIRARHTITLQFPKISLLYPENEQFAGEIHTVDIGLHPVAIAQTETPFFITEETEVYSMFPVHPKFAHKGTFGHALIIAGSYGKMGASVLAARACLHSGTGLVTAHLPACGYPIMQTAVPEVMCSIDANQSVISEIPSLDPYSAVGAGPGLGTCPETSEAFRQLLEKVKVPLVLDADALNILSVHPEWLSELPENTILTPHPGEFRRLFGETGNSWERMQLQRSKSMEYKIIIVLKGANSSISLPGGRVFFNPTGNPGMATGGSGDVLTGIILGLLAQRIPPEMAALAGVYIHGEAGDHAAGKTSQQSLIASDITDSLHSVFQKIERFKEREF
jgi:ADP-dependent NAD(P)H-hydrate dehydratase / NAD(P)H-hydrate epimerase